MKTLHTTAGKLVKEYKEWAQHPEQIKTVEYGLEWTYADFLAWFRLCLDTKINRNDSRNQWRKMDTQYQRALSYDAMQVRSYQQRIRHTGCRNLLHTKEMQARYPHINNQPSDYDR